MPARTRVLPQAAAVGCALLLALMAPPVEAAELGAKQAALAAEREAVQAEHAQAVQACRSRFAVTPCIESADEVRRRALQRIQSQEWAIEEALRQQRTEERRLQREARAAEHARRAAAAPASASASATPVPAAASAAASGYGPPMGRRRGDAASAPAASGEAREAEARRRAERLLQRQEELAQRQARIQAREAQRAASGARGEPLPRP